MVNPVPPWKSGMGALPTASASRSRKATSAWDYSTTTYHAYPETIVSRVFYISNANWNTTLFIRNTGNAAAQVSVIFLENNHVVDSRTYRALPSGSTWTVDTRQVLQEMTDRFVGVAAVYANQSITISVSRQPPLRDVFLPLVLNNH